MTNPTDCDETENRFERKIINMEKKNGLDLTNHRPKKEVITVF